MVTLAWLTERNYFATSWVARDKEFLNFHIVPEEKSAYSRLPPLLDDFQFSHQPMKEQTTAPNTEFSTRSALQKSREQASCHPLPCYEHTQ